MMRFLILLLALSTVMLTFGQTRSAYDQFGGGRNVYGPIQWSRFQEGTQSRIKDFTTRVMVTEGQWQSFWQLLTGNPPSQAPKGVDWNSELLIAVCLGERRSGGFKVDINTIEMIDAANAKVVYAESTPSRHEASASVMTQPWVVVRMKRLPVEIRFERGQPRQGSSFGNTGYNDWGYYGYDQPRPLRWSLIRQGDACGISRQSTLCICSPDEFSAYWGSAFNVRCSNDILDSIDWSNEVVIAINGPMGARGSVGIDSIMLQPNGNVIVTWYFGNGSPSIDRTPYLLLKIPRYSTNVQFRCLPGVPRGG